MIGYLTGKRFSASSKSCRWSRADGGRYAPISGVCWYCKEESSQYHHFIYFYYYLHRLSSKWKSSTLCRFPIMVSRTSVRVAWVFNLSALFSWIPYSGVTRITTISNTASTSDTSRWQEVKYWYLLPLYQKFGSNRAWSDSIYLCHLHPIFLFISRIPNILDPYLLLSSWTIPLHPPDYVSLWFKHGGGSWRQFSWPWYM